MKKFLVYASIVAFFPLMVAANSWLFQRFLGTSYLDWYIINGTFISISASLLTVIWKNLNNNEGLISANPKLFLAANLMLIGSNFQVIGRNLQEAGKRAQEYSKQSQHNPFTRIDTPYLISELVDQIAGMVASLLVVFALSLWFLVIVPFQYFIVLIAGGPARLALKHQKLTISHDEEMGYPQKNSTNFDEWINNFVSAPVSFTNAVAALLILVIKLAGGAA